MKNIVLLEKTVEGIKIKKKKCIFNYKIIHVFS